jgi:hypothetical protein
MCDDAAVRAQLNQLGTARLPHEPICMNPANAKLLRFLCAWRQHVQETFLETKPAGSEKWRKQSICTSELTFLGRKSAKGGLIGVVSSTSTDINNIPALHLHGSVPNLSTPGFFFSAHAAFDM